MAGNGKNGDNYAAATEVWTFSLASDSIKTEPVNTTYISLNNNTNQSGGTLHYRQ